MPGCLQFLLLFLTLGCQCLVSKGTPLAFPLSSEPPQLPDGSEIDNLPLLVPDISKVDGKSLKEVAANKFLALWSVYVSGNDVMVSDEPWTLFLPLNTGLPRDPSFLADTDYTRDILLNHAILGEIVNVETASADPLPYYTLAHSEIVFTSHNGEYFVNDVRLVGEVIELPNAIIYLIEKSLPLEQLEFLDFIPDYDVVDPPSVIKDELLNLVETIEPLSDAAAEDSLKGHQNANLEKAHKDESILFPIEEKLPRDPVEVTPRATRFDKFRNSADKKNTVSKSSPPDSPINPTTTTTTTTSTTKPTTEANLFNELFSLSEKEGKSINVQPPAHEFDPQLDSAIDDVFLSSLRHDLKAGYSNGNEFLHHFNEVHLDSNFQKENNYTAIIPTDDAFYDYYPIDWGFNPFQVDNFTKDALLNHILPGNIDIHSLKNGTMIETLGGRSILVTNDEGNHRSYLNGELVPPEGEVVLPKGRLYFLNKILFVDYDRVNALRDEYPFLETGPLLSYPWPTSPFLSHLFKRLQEGPTTQVFAQLLLNSNIAHLVSSIDQNLNRLSYTTFVPTDEVLQKIFPLEEIELMDSDTISEFLLAHLFHDYILQEDLTDGLVLESLSGIAYPVEVTHNEIRVGNAKFVEPQRFLYNLGAIYIIDRTLQSPILPPSDQSLTEVEKLKSETEALLAKTDEGLEGRQDSPKQEMPEGGIVVPFPSDVFKDIFAQSDPEFAYETRTEISFSKKINDGENIPVPNEVLDRVKTIQ